MCFNFKTPDVPKAPPVPSASSEEAKRRRANEVAANEAAKGRSATIITSPLGDPSYGQNVRRTQLGGL
ncbi:hypothetical protein [Nitratireductor basaltis]|uniref:Uncharacterized protein n=1 Tax=Nitratireductor basaltis TaxID=472175 RepID=A0A084UDK1_9HYPH|nr:hypothetical protein [Nitratireductor basaltis]KFB11037.1 hypothetical protein EL18_02079 [Nitratireductor basaltis]